MSGEHRTITFTEVIFNDEISGTSIEDIVEEEDDDLEGEDLELVSHVKVYEQTVQQEQFTRKHPPPSSLHLLSNDSGKEYTSSSRNTRKSSTTGSVGGTEISVFDFDINFDVDDLDDLADYSVYENRTGLAEDMKFLASMPELCDITFLVGETREPVCAVKAVLASRSRFVCSSWPQPCLPACLFVIDFNCALVVHNPPTECSTNYFTGKSNSSKTCQLPTIKGKRRHPSARKRPEIRN